MRAGRVLTFLVASAVTFTAAGCAQTPPPVSEKVQAYYDETVKASNAATNAAVNDVMFAAVGDSVTEADSPDIVTGLVGAGSWVNYARGNGLAYAGGWADGGASTEVMLSNAKPVKADVLVIIAGTNDFGNGVPIAESEANIAGIAKKVGAKRVIVSAIPPSNGEPETAAAYNTALQAFVKKQGWGWVDSSAKLRTADNTYVDGLTTDGVHPSPAAARMIGESIRAAILG